jgi:hypothetical protein
LGLHLFIDDLRQTALGRMGRCPEFSTRRSPFSIGTVYRSASALIMTLVSSRGNCGQAEWTSPRLWLKGVLDGRYTLPDGFSYQVHSANPVGRANIIGLMDGLLRYVSQGRT